MTETPVEKPLKIFIAVVISVALFSIMNMFAKLAMETQSVPQTMFFRNAVGLIPVLALILWVYRDPRLFKTSRHMGHFVRSIIGFGAMICFFTSFALLPLANASAIHFASPLILVLLSVFFMNERVGPHRWGAVIVGLLAVLFMLQPAGEGNFAGSVVALAAAFMGAFVMIAIRKLGMTENPLTIVFYFSIYSTLFSALWMITAWEPVTGLSLFYLICTGLIGGLAQVFTTYAYAHAPASFVSPFTYLALIFACLLDWAVWGKVADGHILAGSVVVIASGLYILHREARKHYTSTTQTTLEP